MVKTMLAALPCVSMKFLLSQSRILRQLYNNYAWIVVGMVVSILDMTWLLTWYTIMHP